MVTSLLSLFIPTLPNVLRIQRVPSGCVIHSFRHSLRDRLREVECPPDIADAIGGWSWSGIGEQYGSGHALSSKVKYLLRIT